MTPNQLVKFFGSQSKAARHLKVSRQAVSQWVGNDEIPIAAQIDIEVKTGRQLRADLPKEVRAA